MIEADMEARLSEILAANPRGVLVAYLFGSFARGTARADSDVDVAVLYGSIPPSTLDAPQLELESELDRLLGREVQVVVLDTAPIDLVHHILRDGKLVLERDRSARVAFEVRARKEYFDLEPALRLYRDRPSRSQ